MKHIFCYFSQKWSWNEHSTQHWLGPTLRFFKTIMDECQTERIGMLQMGRWRGGGAGVVSRDGSSRIPWESDTQGFVIP